MFARISINGTLPAKLNTRFIEKVVKPQKKVDLKSPF